MFSIRGRGSAKYVTPIANVDDTYTVYIINSGVLQLKYAYLESAIYPVIYLDKNILYKSGSGTSEDPYIVR